jgi:hypothetical protein
MSYLTAADSLGDLARLRADALAHMAAELMQTGNFRDRGDAIRQLHVRYCTIDIMILVDEAIFECKQEIVARMMSDVNHLATSDGSSLNGHPGIFEPHQQ